MCKNGGVLAVSSDNCPGDRVTDDVVSSVEFDVTFLILQRTEEEQLKSLIGCEMLPAML